MICTVGEMSIPCWPMREPLYSMQLKKLIQFFFSNNLAQPQTKDHYLVWSGIKGTAGTTIPNIFFITNKNFFFFKVWFTNINIFFGFRIRNGQHWCKFCRYDILPFYSLKVFPKNRLIQDTIYSLSMRILRCYWHFFQRNPIFMSRFRKYSLLLSKMLILQSTLKIFKGRNYLFQREKSENFSIKGTFKTNSLACSSKGLL